MKFVSDKTVGVYADRLQVLQEKLTKKRAELRSAESARVTRRSSGAG